MARSAVKSIYTERIPDIHDTSGPQRPSMTPSLCQGGSGHYCGTQMARMGYQNAQPNALYECNYEQNAKYYQKCGHGYDCVENGANSFCRCRPGVQYCGYELRLFNYILPANSDHSLFYCNAVQKPKKIESCPGLCSMNNTGDSVCSIRSGGTECQPGARYCGLELTARRLTSRWSPHVLYECAEDGDTRQIEWCPTGCSPDRTSYCKEGVPVTKPTGI